jgi:hypothetical protein
MFKSQMLATAGKLRHHTIATICIALGAHFTLGTGLFLSSSSVNLAHAQSEASIALSLMPIGSVVVVGAAASTAVAAPVVLSVAGTVLVVKTVEVTARGTLYVLERASDGARVSVEISGKAVTSASVGVGTVVTVSVIGAGVILSAAGEAIAFIPNELGKALLHNERITN